MSSTDEMIRMQEDAEQLSYQEFIKKYGERYQYIWRIYNDTR